MDSGLGINLTKKIVKCFSCGNHGIWDLASAWGLLETSLPVQEYSLGSEITYDYHDVEGSLIYQVVRSYTSAGKGKRFYQRRPDPEVRGRWIPNLKGVKRILYRLPDLMNADEGEWIWIVEGEKDADRLVSIGLKATTNCGGAGKWHGSYADALRGRKIAVIPDNDKPGMDHANGVANSLLGKVEKIKVVELPGLSEKSDVSDWLDLGHSVEDLLRLLEGAPDFSPDETFSVLTDSENQFPWQSGKSKLLARRMIDTLNAEGYFLNGGQGRFYFFCEKDKHLVSLDEKDLDLRLLLNSRFGLNARESFYGYFFEETVIEARARGKEALVRQFSHYDSRTNSVLLDMGEGSVLRITTDSIEVRQNGEDQVMFQPMEGHAPWTYRDGDTPDLLFQKIVRPANFSNDLAAFGPKHQGMLFMTWLLSFAFESMMPTKVLAAAIGPAGSGKSTLFRSCGRILIGPEFQVDALSENQGGADDFWVNALHSIFVCIDNVDRNVPFLGDALAQIATGARRSRRQLYTADKRHLINTSCMVAVTSRTPPECLRREDVADRSIYFCFDSLPEKVPEFDIQNELQRLRPDLLSDYARMIQRALRVPEKDVRVADTSVRMADFFRVATRIAMGLGPNPRRLIDEVVKGISKRQLSFVVEDNALLTLLEIWVDGSRPLRVGGPLTDVVPNNGREVRTAVLLQELKALADIEGIQCPARNATSLGRQLEGIYGVLSKLFAVERRRAGAGSMWRFSSLRS